MENNHMMPVWQHNCGCTMRWRGFWQFLGQNSSSRISHNRLHMMAKGLLHCRTRVLARVYMCVFSERDVH